ncbi:MAG TPA: CvpA family protein [Sulfitobacter sp.]|jgi:membrane protein required for colicin V production|uniref:Colicin V production protein n=1 Tax=Sulfitobacter dubius TaxID=218673 RepID=A0ABY3ZKD8_9RHOB|nr:MULTISPECIES: CvpA family protein [Sulfitobacter]MBM05854.1 colicin V production CvpA [Sulfitobacter sp.]UOA15061.1 Colicin V production protein [Sulfitobacter dubius]UOA32013.1 Colicin V production protein [Sulfitobacter sp. DSM 110093]WOI29515.1 CvpA family protein [Sulfitobacter dubius]SFG30083.1 membrane protein required for colicin V production [Sulfitobacter dubius]
MDGFTIIDGVVAVVIILSALLAYGRGLVRELMAIVGWIAAAVLAFLFAPQVEPLVRELPYVGEFLADSCELSVIGAFALVFAAALIIVSLFTPLFSSLVHRSILGGVDQGLGFVFGVVRGVLLVAIAFFVYDTVITGERAASVDNSRSAAVFSRFTGQIEEKDPQEALGWITNRYEALVGKCSA